MIFSDFASNIAKIQTGVEVKTVTLKNGNRHGVITYYLKKTDSGLELATMQSVYMNEYLYDVVVPSCIYVFSDGNVVYHMPQNYSFSDSSYVTNSYFCVHDYKGYLMFSLSSDTPDNFRFEITHSNAELT